MAKALEELHATRDPLVEMAKGILECAWMRNPMLGQRTFGEPAWEILLAVFTAEPSGRLSVAEIAESCKLSEDLVRRWLAVLGQQDLLVVDGDSVELETGARQRLRRVLMAMAANLMSLGESFKSA